MQEGARKSPMDEELQSAIGEALLCRVRENHLRACVIRAAARAARQCAQEVQEEARSACALAWAVSMVHRDLTTMRVGEPRCYLPPRQERPLASRTVLTCPPMHSRMPVHLRHPVATLVPRLPKVAHYGT
jgi:hypothetical protein